LNSGGKIFASGSEIAFDLDRTSGPSQEARDFLHTYFKAYYSGDDANNNTVTFSSTGLSVTFGDTLQGSPYTEEYPDHLFPIAGSSTSSAIYGNALVAGVSSSNTFLLGIPFETIHTKSNRDALMTQVLNSLGITTSVIQKEEQTIPAAFSLEQNYPNPFNPTTNIRFSITEKGSVSLRIFDVLGKEIATILNDELNAGTYSVSWNASGFSSGVYFYRLQTKDFSDTKKLLLTK
jgi:hypothetical protein